VVDEANAIGTAYLRAQLLPPPAAQEIADALRRYVDVRLARDGQRIDEAALRETITETERLHDYLWARAVKAAQQDPSAITGLFVAALNEVIDLHTLRLAAFRNHVPESVFLLLYFVTAMAMAVTGYVAGLGGHRSLWPTAATALLVAIVIFVIMDLDRPRRGLITVSQQSLIDLRDSLNRSSR
jgi:hypothetical protein